MGLRSGVGRGSVGGLSHRWGSLGGRSGSGRGSWAGSAGPGLLRRLVTCGGGLGLTWAALLVVARRDSRAGGVAGWLALGFGWDSSGGAAGSIGGGWDVVPLGACSRLGRLGCGSVGAMIHGGRYSRDAVPLGAGSGVERAGAPCSGSCRRSCSGSGSGSRSCSGSCVKRKAPHGAGLGVVLSVGATP